ncbi:MAG: type IV toxin-antitoxin system AbiEi family antitoxin domain-containing protein [Firmicutes bacterium]|nr:type IV toxin-antitoxin system AbiEi family antitoxin domain-containing protein [Bacillota bacterium]
MENFFELVDASGIILTSDALRAGFTKPRFYKFIKDNQFERVAHGVYASPEAWADENYILSLRCPQAVFSHDEALYYYGLIDREPINQTVTVYTGYGTGRLLKDGICVYTIKKELLDVGKTIVTTSFGHQIPMYDQERTICDLVRNRSKFEIQDFQSALKSYIAKKDKDLNCLMKYAELFRVDRIIRMYVEVML